MNAFVMFLSFSKSSFVVLCIGTVPRGHDFLVDASGEGLAFTDDLLISPAYDVGFLCKCFLQSKM